MRLSIAGRRGLAGALLALALVSSGVAFADDGDDLEAARVAFKEASTLAAEKRWGAACDRYAQSLKLHRAALTLYSLGVAQREAGRLSGAIASFQAFLAEPVTPTTRAYTEPARAAIAELRPRIASLYLVLVPGPIPAVTVTVDGVALPPGTLAQRQPVDPGPHDIVARAPGRAEARAHLTLAEGGFSTVTMTLTPVLAGAAASPGPGTTAAGPGAAGGTEERWPRALPYVLLGAGGALFVGGLALGLVGLADSRGAPSAVGPAADDARAKGLAGDVLAGSGLAAAGVGLVLLLVQRNPAVAAATRPWLQPGAAGVSVRF